MSSTNKTTNYELSQFIETDKPAWLTDYNGDMRTIDSTMKAISDVASGASGSISELADRMSTAEGNITTNANDIDALEARADSLEAQAQSTAGTVANIQTEQTAQNLGIEAATELGYNIARPYDSASTYEIGNYALFQNTLYRCITAVTTGEAFDPSKWVAIKVMDEVVNGKVIYTFIPSSTDTYNELIADIHQNVTFNPSKLYTLQVGDSIMSASLLGGSYFWRISTGSNLSVCSIGVVDLVENKFVRFNLSTTTGAVTLDDRTSRPLGEGRVITIIEHDNLNNIT